MNKRKTPFNKNLKLVSENGKSKQWFGLPIVVVQAIFAKVKLETRFNVGISEFTEDSFLCQNISF